MSRKLRSLRHQTALGTTMTVSLFLMLSACGGGGTDVASIPPPPVTPTPTPNSTPTPTPGPAAGAYSLTRAGTYDLLGRIRIVPNDGTETSRAAKPGEFSMTVSRPSADDGFVYRLNGPSGFLPDGTTSVAYGPGGSWHTDASGKTYGGYSRSLPFSADENLFTFLNLYVGYSYVSMGEWGWDFVHLDGGSAEGYGSLLFVSGDRTPASGIPVSGKATYDARTLSLLSSDLTPGIPFSLTADFGAQTISTRIDQDYRYQPNGDLLDYPAPGIHLGGSAPFSSSGTFDIPLSGTANYSGGYPLNTPETPPTQQVTGDMNGAFFGPNAEQVGGTFAVGPTGRDALLQDAFVGQQKPH